MAKLYYSVQSMWLRKKESGKYYVNTDLTLLSKDKDEPTQMLIEEWNRRF